MTGYLKMDGLCDVRLLPHVILRGFITPRILLYTSLGYNMEIEICCEIVFMKKKL